MDPTLQVIGVVSVDNSALARDVEELIEAFANARFARLQQMKNVWRSRGFSFIYEARPTKLDSAQFMQILFSSAAVHLSSTEPCWRLGALYTLYILYETQGFTPKVKIYLSQEQLSSLVSVVREAKEQQCDDPLRVVRHLMKEAAFLYGHTAATQRAVEEAAERRKKQIEVRLRLAQKKLFSTVPAEEHLFGSLADGLQLDESSSDLIREYKQLKENIFQRINSQEQQQNQITIQQDILQASMEQENFRANFLAEKLAQQQDQQQQESTSTNGDLSTDDFTLDDMEFINDIDDALGSLDLSFLMEDKPDEEL